MATASGNALLATAENSVGNSIERIMAQYRANRYGSYRANCPIVLLLVIRTDAHLVERPPDKNQRNQKESGGQNMAQQWAILSELTVFAADTNRQLDRQQTKQRREIDHRVHRH